MAMGYIGGAVFLGALLYVAGKASPLTKEEKAGARAAGHKLGTIIGVAGWLIIGTFMLWAWVDRPPDKRQWTAAEQAEIDQMAAEMLKQKYGIGRPAER